MKKEIIQTARAPEPIGPYSQAVQIENTLYCSGQIPIDPKSGDMPESIEDQTRQVLNNLQAVLAEAGASAKNVVKTTIFLADLSDFSTVNAIYAEVFGTGRAPARSTVQAAALPKGAKVEIDAIAVLD